MRIITDSIIDSFKTNLYEDEKSDNTIQKYIRDVRFFKAWLNGRTVSKAIVLEYKKELCQNYAPKSVNSIISSLNTLFAFLDWYDVRVKTLKIQRQIFADKSTELAKGEYQKLLSTAMKQKNEQMYYLLQTIGSTGIRISELQFITCQAVKNKKAVINCKGKLRQVFLPKQLCKMLTQYINKKGIKKGSVFVTKNGKPLDRSNVWKQMKKLCEAAGVEKKKVFPHNLRHLFARTFYMIQKDVVRLADILGHSSINTTRLYTMESSDVHCRQIQKLGLLRC